MLARALICLLLATLAHPALGQDVATTGEVGETESEGVESDEESVTTQEIGARLGMEAGGRVTPGGALVQGNYLYRLTDADWLEQIVGFTFGGQGASCFRDRQDEVICDHGIFSGFGLELGVAVRRYFMAQDRFAPFLRAGVAVRGSFFSADDLSGLSLPLWLGGGIRARVAPNISVTADAALKTGFGIYGRDLGLEPHASFSITGGVEFALD